MTAPDAPRPIEAAARFCFSCAGTLVCWAVWLALGGVLAVQLYVAVVEELPVPDFILRRFDARLREAGLDARFRRAQFDPAGKILLEDVEVRSSRFEDPLLLAGSIYAEKSIWSLLSGEHAPDEVRIDRGTLRLPAPLSPTGLPAAFVENLSVTVRLERHLAHLDHLSFRIGNVAVSARGDFQLPAAPGGPQPTMPDLIARTLQIARQLVRELPQLEALRAPTLHAELHARPGVGNVAVLHLAADGVEGLRGLPLHTGPLLARAGVRLDGAGARPLRIEFRTTEARWADAVAASGVAGVLALEFTPGAESAFPDARLQVTAHEVHAFDETAVGPAVELLWRRDRPLHFSASADLRGEIMAVRGRADLATRELALVYDGRVAPALVSTVLPERAPRLAPYFQFGDPVALHGRADFASGWKFTSLETRVRVGRLNSNNVRITSARGRITVDAAGNFLADDAAVVADRSHARGSYWMNFRSFDYRMLLTGGLEPPHIAGWFRSDWWLMFWTNFRFGALPTADVDVGGCWRDPARTVYFGSSEARGAQVLGAELETARARVFLRPGFAHAFDLHATRAGGAERAQGWFKRIADPATRELARFEYDLAGNLAPEAVRHLGGAAAETLLQGWTFNRPPHIAFRGHSDYTAGVATPDLEFEGQATGGLSYQGFPIEAVETRGRVQGDRVQLERIALQVAGGRGDATATLEGTGAQRRLAFDLRLADADMVRTIGALSEFERARAGQDAPPSPNRELLKRASGGKLQFALAASGAPADLASFAGQGSLQITGAELGEIHLFGLLSQVLSGLSLNFSSLKLDSMRGNIVLARGQANFPDLRITGPSAVIEAKGDYRLLDQTLDFSARLKPYEENRNLFTAAIGIVINPLTSILELRLTGPIHKPSWSLSLGGNTPMREAPAPRTTPPEPPAQPTS